MEKLLTVLHELIESKSVPTVFKAVVFLLIVALGMSSAGFPVVKYTESLAAKLWEHQKLVGALIGLICGVTGVQMARPLIQVAKKTTLAIVRNDKMKVADRVMLVSAIYMLLFSLVVTIVLTMITFLAWTVAE